MGNNSSTAPSPRQLHSYSEGRGFEHTQHTPAMAVRLKVCKVPTDELALTNCAILSPRAFAGHQHLTVTTGPARHFLFTVRTHPEVRDDEIAFSLPQRKWAGLSLHQELDVKPRVITECVVGITLAVDFSAKKYETTEPLNSDAMAREFSMQFVNRGFTKGEFLIYKFTDEKGRSMNLSVIVKSIEGMNLAGGADQKTTTLEEGKLIPNSAIIFDKEDGAMINLIGKSKGKSAYRSIINPDWDFSKLGIGGLDKEFTAIFRRAFASRVYPPEFIEQMGMKHVRGILLFGPPGTGKTLMARQIGKMLNAREPKIVNGPQILDKYVGESEANIRKLFAEAEEEQKRCGPNSGLHIIIFDEIDAICKQRGSMAGSSSVHDTVVNQLLSKMDGVEQLNNILVIGMTNRRDMIDEALMRPGRLELQMEINLPDEFGRLQIFKIHTARMREYDKIDPLVDLAVLSKKTKNFSGAEIEGLVRAAQSSAMNRLVKLDGKAIVDPDAIEKLLVNMGDFEYALENDIKPAFGCADDKLARFLQHGLTMWSPEVEQVLQQGELFVKNAKTSKMTVKCCLAGAPMSGKSGLAAQIAKMSGFPFVKVVSPADMIGYTEPAKCTILKKALDDAMRSPLSVLLLDDLEELVDYCAVGPRFSNLLLRTLAVMLKQDPPPGHRLLVLATCSDPHFLREFGLTRAFHRVIDVPLLSTPDHIAAVIEQSDMLTLTPEELMELKDRLGSLFQTALRGVGIKSLLSMLNTAANCEDGYRVKELTSELEAYALGL